MFPRLGGRLRGRGKIPTRGRRRLAPRRSLSYAALKAEVMAAIEALSTTVRNRIFLAGTLPEIMVGLALARQGIPAQAQVSEEGGRLRIGGSIVDYKVFLGRSIIIVRVQGTYWHNLPGVKAKDMMQLRRLRQLGYRVADIWEHDLYVAWAEGRLDSFVRKLVMEVA